MDNLSPVSGTESNANPNSAIVKLEHVSKFYHVGEVRTDVLKDTSLEIYSGEFVVVLGSSGCGKTTLLNLIGALDTSSTGKVIVDGEDISHGSPMSLTTFRREKLGYIFQFYNLLPTLTAAENVAAGLEILSLSKDEIKGRIQYYLEQVGLGDKTGKFPSQLSGGEQQRVAIARALAKRPNIVLGDEPTGNLDEVTEDIIMDLMKKLNKETGASFIIVTHNPKIADLADRVIRIRAGKIQEEGSDPT